MRSGFLGISAVLAFTAVLAAQEQSKPPKAEIFGGYSLTRAAPCGQNGGGCNFESHEGPLTASFNGWNASATGYFSKSWGVTGEVSGHYGSDNFAFGGSAKYSNYTYLVGPVYAIRLPTATPFIHGLFGGVSWSSPTNLVSYNALGWAVGGGVDINGTPRIAVRVVQLDYLGTRVPGANKSSLGSGWRYSAGIVFKF